jgi:hypothetical protein
LPPAPLEREVHRVPYGKIQAFAPQGAQVPFAKKAAALKAAAGAKRPQPVYLQRSRLNAPTHETPPSLTPERLGEAHQSQGPPRLLNRHEVLAITGNDLSDHLGVDARRRFPALSYQRHRQIGQQVCLALDRR